MKKRLSVVPLLLTAVFALTGVTALALPSTSPAAPQATTAPKPVDTVTIYLARHGKTLFNTTDRVQGWSDTPLTAAGAEVAAALGLGLQAEKISFDGAYSSDLGRAIQTANVALEAMGQGTMPVGTTDKLREVCYGSYEGEFNSVAWNKIAQVNGYKDMEAMMKDPKGMAGGIGVIIEGFRAIDELGIAESYDQVAQRMEAGLREITEEAMAKGQSNILVVSSGMSIGAMIDAMDLSDEGAQLANAAVCKIVYANGVYTLETINDLHYVEAGQKLQAEAKAEAAKAAEAAGEKKP